MDLFWFKILAIILIIGTGLLGGLIPLSKGFKKGGLQWLNMGNALAGGIFLGAGLLHMLPDAFDGFSQLNFNIDFPFAALICGGGFFLVLFIEKVLVGEKATNALADKGHQFPYVLFFVLAIHSIIAGASLGLESGLLSSIAIFIAIIAHKGSAAFSLGVSLVQQQITKKRIRISILFFSVMTPLGILLGSLFASLEGNSTAVLSEAIFDSLAAGTFIYIAVMDIIDEVFESRDKPLQHFTLMILGFLVMALIAIWT